MINYSQSDLIIHKQPHKESRVPHEPLWIYWDDDNISQQHSPMSTCCFSETQRW